MAHVCQDRRSYRAVPAGMADMPAAREAAGPSARYADQSTTLGTRLVGLCGTGAIALAILAALFLTWQTYATAPPVAVLTAFDVARPAAPVQPTPPDPGPPVRETTAPVSKPVPPAPQASSAKPTWQGLVLGALDKVKRYPRDAHFARQQGVPYIRFTMDRQGKVLAVSLERSSGIRSLDREAQALPKRAQPLPKPPEDVKGETIELVVPVEFFMR